MSNSDQLAILKQGGLLWNQWRKDNPAVTPDLQQADLRDANLSGADLSGVNFRSADLSNVVFEKCDLTRANLRDAILRGADLGHVSGALDPEQLAGADLAGAILAESLKELFKTLDAAKAISGNAQKVFVAMLAACLYSWLTIATTNDVNLVTNRASSPLPVIQTSIPIVGFYIVTPLILLGLYIYFHFYLQKLWEELGTLPAIFPDGRPLQTKADPWLLSDLVRSHVSRLRAGRPFFSYLQKWISVLLAWWLVPITLVLFWARFLPRHDFAGTVYHAVLTAICVTAGVSLYRLAGDTLKGNKRKPFQWRSALTSVRTWEAFGVAIAACAGLMLISVGAIRGVRTGSPGRDWWPESHGPQTWVPRTLALAGYSPFADLRAADLSLKPANWTGKSEPEIEGVAGIQMQGVDLRYADLRSTFLPRSILTDAHMEGADLLLAIFGRPN